METMLPEPTISFTIPSYRDATVLSCRVYHPPSLSGGSSARTWGRHAAVFAHPYAPLGGCADDHVVDVVAGTMLRKGYLVGTFNFRGAGDSGGRTSWTAKAERADYISIAAFMVYYIHYLDPFRGENESVPPAQIEPPVLIMGGYSYGSMITMQLPPLAEMLRPFVAPELGTAAGEIRLRAEHLAEHQNAILASVREAWGHGSRLRSPGLRVGGTESGEVRGSIEGRRSFILEAEGRIRKSFGDVVAKTKRARKSRDGAVRGKKVDGDQEVVVEEEEEEVERRGHACLEEVTDLVMPRVAYVLVSPLQGIISHLASMSIIPAHLPSLPKLRNPFRQRKEDDKPTNQDANNRKPPGPDSDADSSASDPATDADAGLAELKLVRNPTLAAFGDRDVFVPANKLRSWAKRLQEIPGSMFHAVEVSSAGHFWVEDKVLGKLAGLVDGFTGGLIEEGV